MKVVCADVYMCHSTSNSGYVTFCEKSVVNFFVMGEKISLQKYFDLKNIPLDSSHWDLSKTAFAHNFESMPTTFWAGWNFEKN